MSSLRSLYLRWCCQVGVEHGCARPGSARQRGHGGTSLGTGHELRAGSRGWLKTPRLGARKQRAPVSSAGLSPGTPTLHPCPSTRIPRPGTCCRLPALAPLPVAQPRPSTPKSCPSILLQHPTSCSGSPPQHPAPCSLSHHRASTLPQHPASGSRPAPSSLPQLGDAEPWCHVCPHCPLLIPIPSSFPGAGFWPEAPPGHGQPAPPLAGW